MVKSMIEGSNRTFMELKYSKIFLHKIELHRSNRTFMELKYRAMRMQFANQLVLIVPLWN